jgi:hypothetical protein
MHLVLASISTALVYRKVIGEVMSAESFALHRQICKFSRVSSVTARAIGR